MSDEKRSRAERSDEEVSVKEISVEEMSVEERRHGPCRLSRSSSGCEKRRRKLKREGLRVSGKCLLIHFYSSLYLFRKNKHAIFSDQL